MDQQDQRRHFSGDGRHDLPGIGKVAFSLYRDQIPLIDQLFQRDGDRASRYVEILREVA